MHKLITLDLVLDLKMGIKHHLYHLSHVIPDVVQPQGHHGLFSHHVLDVEDTALSLQPSSENFEALVGNPNTATINLEEYFIVV